MDPLEHPDTSAEAFAPGSQVDHFQVVRLLGRGGMGEVYLARDTTLGRRVALKVIHPGRLGSEAVVERFLREARTTAAFSHPNIVAIHYAGSHAGRPYLALEYLEGATLRARLREGQPGTMEALRWLLAVAEALAEAHGHRVLHRDLKPENIMLCRDGRLRVVDFGLARPVQATSSPPALVAEPPTAGESGGPLRGTPEYMAPEQWRTDGVVTEAADIWALGTVLHETLCGQRPYGTASFFGLALKVGSADPVPVSDTRLPPVVVELVRRCLDKDPTRRPAAAEVAEALRRLVDGDRRRLSAEQGPFRGLRPFLERHAALFFGRDQEVAALLEQLREEPVMPVVGPSGAGKSSFIQAGVIPRLREQGPWVVIALRPGEQPFRSLSLQLHAEGALSPDGSVIPRDQLQRRLQQEPHLLSLMLERMARDRQCRVLLFVDQLEELYTLGAGEAERRCFMDLLCSAADDAQNPMRVIFTLREDFLGQLAGGSRVRQVLGRLTLLGPPDAVALESVMTEPLSAVDHQYDDPHLVPEMIEAAGGGAASLPLLQFTAQMLWERRDRERRVLTRAAYEAMGRVEGALASHAEGVMEGLPASARRRVREIFLRLVTAQKTRRVLSAGRLIEGLGPQNEAELLLDRLVAARLVSVRKARQDDRGETEVELVHESLIHHWGRLSRWIERSREDIAFLGEVEQAAESWHRRGCRVDDLWQGEVLEEALAALGRCRARVPAQVVAFLEAGRAQRLRRLRLRRVVVALALAVALVVALVMSYQKRQADQQRRSARHRWAEAQREGARSALGRLELLEARSRLRGSLETEDSVLGRWLWWRLRHNPQVWSRRLGTSIYSVAFSPDGMQVAAASQDRAVYLLDTRTREVQALRGYPDQVVGVAFSPSGDALAASTWSGKLTLRQLKSGTLRVLENDARASKLAFIPDGRRLVTTSGVGPTYIHDLRHGGRKLGLSAQLGLAVSRDGRWMALAGRDGVIQLWSIDPAGPGVRHVASLAGHNGSVSAVSFSDDGRLLASGGVDNTVRVWDLTRRRVVHVLRGHLEWVTSLAFDSRWVYSASKDGTIRGWNARGELQQVLQAHSGGVLSLSIRSDARLLVSGGKDGCVRLWRLGIRQAQQVMRGHGEQVLGLALSPDGKLLASGGHDAMVRLWSVEGGEQRQVLQGSRMSVNALTFSPDGRFLSSIGQDGELRLWQRAIGFKSRVLGSHWAAGNDVSYSPDGKLLATAGDDKRVRVWDAVTGVQRALLVHDMGVNALAFAPGGTRMASVGRGGAAHLWDLARLPQVVPIGPPLHQSASLMGVSFTADGRSLLTGGASGQILLWDLQRHTSRSLWNGGARSYRLAIDPSGQWAGVPWADHTGLLIPMRGGEPVRLKGHRAEVNILRFSVDGKRAATASDDGTVRLWQVPSGAPLWRAPVMLSHPPRLLTHRGWLDLDRDGPPRLARIALERTLGQGVRTAHEAADGTICALTGAGDVERREHTGRRVARWPAGGATRVLAIPDGCVARGPGARVAIHWRQRPVLQLTASVVGYDDGELLLVQGRRLWSMRPDGTHTGVRREVSPLVTAVARVGMYVALGFLDGSIDIVSLQSGGPVVAHSLESVPPSEVVQLVPGPRGTLVAGFASGDVGIWHLQNGSQLERSRLHGAVAHLALWGQQLYVASELGDHIVLDLSTFHMGYCEMLRQVWRDVPTVWENGVPLLRAPPLTHPCARAGAGRPAPPRWRGDPRAASPDSAAPGAPFRP